MTETFKLDIIAPDKTLLSESVKMAVIPGVEGDFGVLPRHAPFMSSLRPGLVNIQGVSEGDAKTLFISGGFASVENNTCIILADYAKPLSEIKRDQVVSRIEKIKSEIIGPGANENDLRRELAICQAMLAVAGQ